MSNLIPNITITELRKIHARDLKRMKSVEVFSDGEHLYTAVIPKGEQSARDYIRAEVEELAHKSNLAVGVDPEEIFNAPISV